MLSLQVCGHSKVPGPRIPCCGPNLLLSKVWSLMQSWWPRLMGTCSMMPLGRSEKMGEAHELMIIHVNSHTYHVHSYPIIVFPVHLHSPARTSMSTQTAFLPFASVWFGRVFAWWLWLSWCQVKCTLAEPGRWPLAWSVTLLYQYYSVLQSPYSMGFIMFHTDCIALYRCCGTSTA